MNTKKHANGKVAFLDFEFGTIYGSHRRDFLITEAAVLIYDCKNQTLKLGEIILKPDLNVVLRKKYKNDNGKVKKIEKVYNLHSGETFKYDKNFRLSQKEKIHPRKIWNRNFYKKLTTFLNSSLNNIDTIYVYGGNEDINLLNRYNIKYSNIIDLQSILQKRDRNLFPEIIQNKIDKKTQHSLGFFIEHLGIQHTLDDNRLVFREFNYQVPAHMKFYNYNVENFEAHCASGDCIRVFSLYKALI